MSFNEPSQDGNSPDGRDAGGGRDKSTGFDDAFTPVQHDAAKSLRGRGDQGRGHGRGTLQNHHEEHPTAPTELSLARPRWETHVEPAVFTPGGFEAPESTTPHANALAVAHGPLSQSRSHPDNNIGPPDPSPAHHLARTSNTTVNAHGPLTASTQRQSPAAVTGTSNGHLLPTQAIPATTAASIPSAATPVNTAFSSPINPVGVAFREDDLIAVHKRCLEVKS